MFFAFLLIQYSKVFIYYDDFGYLSLSYGNGVMMPDVHGSEFNLKQLAEFMRQHYLYVNGRILYAALFPLLYMVGGLTLVRFLMSASVNMALILTYRIVMKYTTLKGWKPFILAVYICLLYGTIEIFVQRHSTYWFAASFLYVVPVTTFLALATSYYGTIEEIVSVNKKAICLILAYLASFSQEQWLVASISYIVMIIIFKIYKHYRISSFDFGMLVAAVAGALPILTSPAVKSRMANHPDYIENSFIEKILSSIVEIINVFFTSFNRIYILLLLSMLMLFATHMLLNSKRNWVFNFIYLIFSIGTLIYQLSRWNVFKIPSSLMAWVLFTYMVITAIQLIRWYYNENQVFLGMVFIASTLTLACLVVVPEFPSRVLIPFIFLSFISLGFIFSKVLLLRKKTIGVSLILGLLSVGSIYNMSSIYNGYKINYGILVYNDGIIRNLLSQIHSGHNIPVIYLYRNPEPRCSGEMVYEEEFSFMIRFIQEYYELPSNVELRYETYPGS